MTGAADMVERMLRWATAPTAAPPLGEPFGLAALLSPPATLDQALADLATTTAARCALSADTFGKSAGPGAGAVWMAAALALRWQPELAAEVLRRSPPPLSDWSRGGWDLIARHGMATAALQYLPPTLVETMISASPLTALLLLPPRGEEDRTLMFGQSLIAAPADRQLVVTAFADPAATAAQLGWRANALSRLVSGADRSGHTFALDVYETAVAWHGTAWLRRVEEGAAILRSLDPPEPSRRSEPTIISSSAGASGERAGAMQQAPASAQRQPEPDRRSAVVEMAKSSDGTMQFWELAVAIGRWWQPLLALRRRNLDAIRDRDYLDFRVYWSGLRLATVTERLYQG